MKNAEEANLKTVDEKRMQMEEAGKLSLNDVRDLLKGKTDRKRLQQAVISIILKLKADGYSYGEFAAIGALVAMFGLAYGEEEQEEQEQKQEEKVSVQ
jgi:hypothetical protein